MKHGKIGATRRLGMTAGISLIFTLGALTSGAASSLQGLVVTGGTLTLDFADPSSNSPSTTLDRLDVMNWSGGSGALAGQNLVFRGPNTSVDTCTEPVSSFGQISPVYPGETAAFANRTTLTMTSITLGGACAYDFPPDLTFSQTTVYTAFPAGDPDANEFRVARTFPALGANAVGGYNGSIYYPLPFNPQYFGYLPAVSSTLFGTVLYPNTAGTITAVTDSQCTQFNSDNTDGGCIESDWAGGWFADDNGSGSGILVRRDAASTTPAVLNVFFPAPINVNFFGSNANQNLTMILMRPTANASGGLDSFTETEWVCAYDPTTWTAAARTAGTLPTGCAGNAPTSIVSPQFAFTPVNNAIPGSLVTSDVVHLTGLASSSISIIGGSYSINGGAYGSATQTISGDVDLAVQVTASDSGEIWTQGVSAAIVTINGVSSEFLVLSAFYPIVEMSLSSTTIALGQQATVSWNSYMVQSCTAGGAWSGTQQPSGSFAITPTSTGTFTYSLDCTAVPPDDSTSLHTLRATPRARAGVRGHTSDTTSNPLSTSVTLNVTAAGTTPAPTVTLSANPASVTVGGSSTLTWSSANATTCTASGAWTGTEPTSGSLAETPAGAGTDTYTLTCTGAGGSASANAAVTATTPAPTVSIAVEPTSITVGESASLTWSSTNATSCAASGAWTGTQAVSGSSTKTPDAAGAEVYTLSCSGNGGSASASATLNVDASSTVTTTSTGRIGGGGAMDLASLLGLLSVAWRVRVARRRPGVSRVVPTVTGSLLAGLLMSAGNARAADDFDLDAAHSYVGLRAGESIYQPSVSSILTSVGPDGADVTALSIGKHQFGGVVYAGVPIWHSLSLEIGYAQIGQFPLSMTTVTHTGTTLDHVKGVARTEMHATPTLTEVDAIAQEVVNAAPPAGHGVTLGLALPIDITSRISLTPRFAALVYQSKQTLTTPDTTVRSSFWGSGFDVGGTATARVFGSLYLGAGIDCFHQTRSCDAVVLEGVIEYRFGH